MGWRCRLGGLQKVKLRCAGALMALSVAPAFERRQTLGYWAQSIASRSRRYPACVARRLQWVVQVLRFVIWERRWDSSEGSAARTSRSSNNVIQTSPKLYSYYHILCPLLGDTCLVITVTGVGVGSTTDRRSTRSIFSPKIPPKLPNARLPTAANRCTSASSTTHNMEVPAHDVASVDDKSTYTVLVTGANRQASPPLPLKQAFALTR